MDVNVESLVTSIRKSRKYRVIAPETIRFLAQEEWDRHRSVKEVEQAVRKRLHNIVASFLGDPDYKEAAVALKSAFVREDNEVEREACIQVMSRHISTRERLPILKAFYRDIFRITGKPRIILDIACGLNPIAFPWMDLPVTTLYHAYDIHQERVDFINLYFTLEGLPPLAHIQDVAVNMPQEEGDVVFFFKELHRFEENYQGRGLLLLENLHARYLIVSFPAISLQGGRSLVKIYRLFMQEMIAGKGWPSQELLYANELVFVLDKGSVS